MGDTIVVKFGGSSLADSSQFKKVKDIVTSNDKRRFVVPSAPGKRYKGDHKVTDLLYMCHQLASHGLNFDEVFNLIKERYTEISRELNLDVAIEDLLNEIKLNISNGASKDYTASRGEYLNGVLLAAYLGFEFIDPKDLILFDEDGYFNQDITEANVSEKLEGVPYAVVPGFYGANKNGEITTFSRGGSDITGSIIASGVRASLYENWTDVSGFLVADPNIVADAMPMDLVTYRELRELSYMGAPVLHEEAIFPVRKYGIPINIRNTNVPLDKGTMIVDDSTPVKYKGITGISGKKDFVVISVEKTMMTLEKDFFRKLISVFETNDIPIEHMPSSIDSVSIVVQASKINHKLKKIIEEIRIFCNPDNIVTYPDMSLIAVVGRGMIRTKGISAKTFTALEKADINTRMIVQGSSELNIIIGVENKDFEKAIEAIYRAFY
ncbi:MAG: aspartate kinase [Tissierellia bacterium]|nr:aspartate kinase [Tissierellia bacterium]